VILAVAAWGDDIEKARQLFQKTEYEAALAALSRSPDAKNPKALEIEGRSAYMLGNFKKAIEYFEAGAAAERDSSNFELWLGRAWGRRAETSNPLFAPNYASRARQHFEKAVELDPKNQEAVSDLFSYYLQAPGFLGGGLDKASALAEKAKSNDPVEYHYALAQIAQRSHQFDAAERQLRRAVELAPKQVGRLVDLARFLATRGRYQESETTFEQAAKIDPSSPVLLFGRAQTYIEARRNMEEARKMLERYLVLPLTPDDPPRDEAVKLLKLASGG
jgi:tetratricopeptide (TPR) repeat protein